MVCACVHVHTPSCTYTYAHMHTSMHAHILNPHTCTHNTTYRHTCTHMHACIHTQAHIQICTLTCIHTCTHTYIMHFVLTLALQLVNMLGGPLRVQGLGFRTHITHLHAQTTIQARAGFSPNMDQNVCFEPPTSISQRQSMLTMGFGWEWGKKHAWWAIQGSGFRV